MKNKLILRYGIIILFLINNVAKAQEFDVQLNPTLYAGGYNISCHGANTGAISLFITGGTSPYTFVWNDGPVTRNRTNLTAGNYSVTVTSSNGTSIVRSMTLTEPNIFHVSLIPREKNGGYHISENGRSDGEISVEISGGVPPYTYLWSNGSTSSEGIEELSAGTYSLSVHDATNCTTTASTTLIEPTVLHIVSIASPQFAGGYNVTSCNDQKNGSINLAVAGGTPPYRYQWSNGAFTKNLINLEPGEYTVQVHDTNDAVIQVEKIEESYLYLLQLNKKIERLELKNKELEQLLIEQTKK